MGKKTLPEKLAAVLTVKAVRERSIRLMFQDESRFGRMARIRRCWAQAPSRPVVCNGYEREFTYVYGAVSPLQGHLDWSLSEKMNTAQMTAFLSQVSQAHPQEFIVMVVDGASSHKAKELVVPENVRLIPLPGYSPELNPQEHIWDDLREKAFPNLVLDRMAAVVERLTNGMGALCADTERVRSITAWPWIVSLNLNAN
jgi:DDE superfamily endonuclease